MNFKKLLIALVVLSVMSLLNAQSRSVIYGTVMNGPGPLSNARVVVSISSIKVDLFAPVLPENTTSTDSNGQWILSINFLDYPETDFDRIKINVYFCRHDLVGKEIILPYSQIINHFGIVDFGSGGIVLSCSSCSNGGGGGGGATKKGP